MLRHKITTNLSELQKYFSSSEKVIQTLFRELQSFKIHTGFFKVKDKVNTQHPGKQVFLLILLFPLFAVQDISHFAGSALSQLYRCGKDVFYGFLNCPLFDWRKFSYHVTKKIICRIADNSHAEGASAVRCLIADDTDLPKRGRCFELLSRIYSHVTHSYNYGFKGLFLNYHDGKSLFNLDFSLHGEKGTKKETPYGLTKKQTKRRFTCKRPGKSKGQQRVNEYFKAKTEMLIQMLRGAISAGIKFDYLLTDSWFTNYEPVRFIVTRKINCFFLGMVKNGNTKYSFNGQELTFGQILKILKHSRKAKDSKQLKCKYYEVEGVLKGIAVKLFFCKTTRKNKWHGLLTTDTALTFEEAFEIYVTRWTIEVFFKECKQLLRMGKCESRHFDAQIAATSLCVLQYNLLSMVKRFDGYESLGMLFRLANAETIELTVKERILQIIKEVLIEYTENMDLGIDFFLEHIFVENEQFKNLINLKTLARAG